MLTQTLIVSITILAANAQQNVPSWNVHIANDTNKSHGLPTIPETHYTIYNSTMEDGSANPNVTYAQGAIMTKWKETYYVS